MAQKRFSLRNELQEPVSKSSFVTKEKDHDITPKSFIERKVSGFGKVLAGKLERSLALVSKNNKIDQAVDFKQRRSTVLVRSIS